MAAIIIVTTKINKAVMIAISDLRMCGCDRPMLATFGAISKETFTLSL